MAFIQAKGVSSFHTNKLIIKSGPGYKVGLWANTQKRFGYAEYSKGDTLSIIYNNADCKLLKVGNCAWIYGATNLAKVGNTIECEGEIITAGSRNRVQAGNVHILSLDEEIKARMDREIAIILDTDPLIFPSSSRSEENVSARRKQIENKYKRSKSIIKINGPLESLVIQEPTGISVEVMVIGKVGEARIGNCLKYKGTINLAQAGNVITATSITNIIPRDRLDKT